MSPRPARPRRRRSAGALGPFTLVAVGAIVALAACSDRSEDDAEGSAGRTNQQAEALAAIDCSASTAQGYVQGKPMSIEVVTIGDKPVEVDTANAYYVMAQAAARNGVELAIVSGFRTMKEQEYLYGCYTNCNCNSCNLAAKPGYSNHQSGHALDLNTSSPGVYAWLEAHGSAYGFKRTVPSEIWHWEWWGGGPGGGPCTTAHHAEDASGAGTGSGAPAGTPDGDGDAGDGAGAADEADPNGGGLGDLPPLNSSDGCALVASHARGLGSGGGATLLIVGAALAGALATRRRRRRRRRSE